MRRTATHGIEKEQGSGYRERLNTSAPHGASVADASAQLRTAAHTIPAANRSARSFLDDDAVRA